MVLFGKPDPKANTSGDSKITVYERIAQKLFPDDFQDHPKTLGKRVKGKTEDLCKIYKEKAALLRQTGGGVGAPEEDNTEQTHYYLDYYIPHDGPHHDTPQAAKNIWEQINNDFPYFSELHKFLSTRPNIVVHNQQAAPRVQNQVQDSQIDPVLLNMTPTPPPRRIDDPEDQSSSPTARVVRSNDRIRAQQAAQPGAPVKAVKGPKPSTFGTDLSNAVEKVSRALKHIPKKCSLEDMIIESSRENIKIARERAEAQAEHHHQSLLVTQKAQLMEMLKLGIYTVKEVKVKIAELDAPSAAPKVPRTPRTPRTPRHAAVTPNSHCSSPRINCFSPTWDIEDGKSLPDDVSEF
ncbi:hypothetical protein C8F04DRAFT_1258313 [Mycena alexandri]|uniref:Uncharacterized protein n=1 Tax=Mycena alexandri TaxID=1745969 RepID=A0AAD6X277_9AGAR|nr:hypothetical protein C8F04DRAFT_1258313 [Mycena alexandri]